MSHNELRGQMEKRIAMIEPGKEFSLRDIMGECPSVLGKTLFESVRNGNIPNVECLGKFDGVDKYRKK